jgi:hypothetical protein
MRCEYEEYDGFRGERVWHGFGFGKEVHGFGWFCTKLLKKFPKYLLQGVQSNLDKDVFLKKGLTKKSRANL